PDEAIRSWTARLLSDAGSITPSIRRRLAELARGEPDAEVRSALAGLAARLEPAAALAVVRELIRRPQDVADKHIPLRIWWALEKTITSDADLVLNWIEKENIWQEPVFSEHLEGRIARRLAADRGNNQSFTRIDPDRNWKEYAQYPRSQMPGGKGDYTDWQTNYTPEISDGNLTRLTRFLEMAPSTHRDRLLAGAKAGLGEGTPPARVPARLSALIGKEVTARPDADERGREAFLIHCAP